VLLLCNGTGSEIMGRKKEHVASKSFTIGLKELAFLAEEADRLNVKQSKLLTKYVRTIMLERIEKEKVEHGPVSWCGNCASQQEWIVGPKRNWLCRGCGVDKTELISAMFPTHQI